MAAIDEEFATVDLILRSGPRRDEEYEEDFCDCAECVEKCGRKRPGMCHGESACVQAAVTAEVELVRPAGFEPAASAPEADDLRFVYSSSLQTNEVKR
jgi:hypothetical protein